MNAAWLLLYANTNLSSQDTRCRVATPPRKFGSLTLSKYRKGLELTDSTRGVEREVVKELWIVETHLIGEQSILMSRRKVCIICSVVIGKIGNGIRNEAAKREASLAIWFFKHIADSLNGIA